MNESYDSLKAWLASRPESVQKLAEKVPVNAVHNIDGVEYFVLGYSEDGDTGGCNTVIMSEIDPRIDYKGAYAAKKYICFDCLEFIKSEPIE